MHDRRILELNALQFTEFNPRHRELYIKLNGNIEKIRAAIHKKTSGEE